MYAVNFEIDKTKLMSEYGVDLTSNEDEINSVDHIFGCLGFKKYNEGFYICSNDYDDGSNLHLLYTLIETLRDYEWFRNTVTKMQAFRVHDISDFTTIIKCKV